MIFLSLSSIFEAYERDGWNSTFQGHPNLSGDASVRIQEDFRRRRQELQELLKLGRTVVLFVPAPDHCFVDTGNRTHSGTGKNRETTQLVNQLELFSVLPFALGAEPAKTAELELVADEPFAGFWRVMRGRFESAARLTSAFGTPILRIRGTDAVVASFARMKAGGTVLLVPERILYSDEDDEREAEDVAEADDDVAAEEEDEPLKEDVEFLDAVFELVRQLRVDAGDFRQPEWSARFTGDRERAAREAVRSADAAAAEVNDLLDRAKASEAELVRWKTLFTGSGPALETVVAEAFASLGFSVEEGQPGRTDRILRLEGRSPIVLEVKGRAKSAAESDSAQLEKWASELLVAEGTPPKPVLLVNAWREVPLTERGEAAFPEQMLGYASARNHCLLTGLQLLGAVEAVGADASRREEIVDALYETSGIFPLFSDWTEFVAAEATAASATAQDPAGAPS